MVEQTAALRALEAQLPGYHLRGQWQHDTDPPARTHAGARNQMVIEPEPAGVPHLWKYGDVVPLLERAVSALTASFTARRSLILTNPGLPQGTTQTLLAAYQIIEPGESAWAHRHSMAAIRFGIEGGDKVVTVVDGRSLPMKPYDLILTPAWTWHDHHNESGQRAIWLDGLDVPFALALNQNYYEELGESWQERLPDGYETGLLRRGWRSAALPAPNADRPYRYPWQPVRAQLDALAGADGSPTDGIVLDYLDPLTGGPVLPTLGCRVQLLPPGFRGAHHRHSASSIYFVVEGEGEAVVEDDVLAWTRHDSFVVPNWSWRQLVNRSRTDPAVLFSMHDTPILRAFGLYREETGNRSESGRPPS